MVEGILHELLSESVQLAQLVLVALEDAAIFVGQAAIVGHLDGESVTSTMLSLGKGRGSAVLYNGVPVISTADLRLALLLSRVIYLAAERSAGQGKRD
jgi:hypothetical protein